VKRRGKHSSLLVLLGLVLCGRWFGVWEVVEVRPVRWEVEVGFVCLVGLEEVEVRMRVVREERQAALGSLMEVVEARKGLKLLLTVSVRLEVGWEASCLSAVEVLVCLKVLSVLNRRFLELV
jgi:hypothetical protein